MRKIFTLSELQQCTHAYDKFATIAECDIPDYYKEIFPHKCECGAEMIMTNPGRTQLQCCNPACYIKMAHKLAYFVSSLGYKGFGPQSSLSLYRAVHNELPFNSFLSIFRLNETQMAAGLSDHYIQVLLDIKNDVGERAFPLVTAISALGITNIGRRSMFFDVVKTPVVLLSFVLDNNTEQLCDICGIQAAITRFQLSMARADIATLISEIMPNILSTPKREVYVAITGKVSVNGSQYTRAEFISLCEAIKDEHGEQMFKLTETKASDKLEFVIADDPSSSDKYRLGQKLHKLITADEFYNNLLSRVPAPDIKQQEDSKEENSDG